MNRNTVAGVLALLILLLYPATSQAHTGMFGGYIVAVKDGDLNAKPGGGPSLTTVRAWDSDDGDDGIYVMAITKEHVCFLDGKKLDPADFMKAVKPGMAYRCLSDCSYLRVYSDPGLLPTLAGAALGKDGELTLRIKAVSPLVCYKAGGQPDRRSGLARDVVLHLTLTGGRIASGMVVVPRLGPPWQDADTTGLELKDGKLTGMVKMPLRARPGSVLNGKPEEACALALDGTVAPDGVLAGTYTGTVGDKTIKGSLGGEAQPARDVRGDLGVWMRLDYDAVSGEGSRAFIAMWTFTRKDGQFIGGPTVECHRHTSGKVEKGAFQFDGNTFRGEMSADGKTCIFKGQITGGIIYGTFTDANGKTGRCRGEIRRPDAPPAWGWIEPHLKVQIAKGEYPE